MISQQIPQQVADFLHEQGNPHVYCTQENSLLYALYFDIPDGLGKTCEEQLERSSALVQEFETLEAPLLRFECWPDECHAAHSITGAPKPGGTDYSRVFIVEAIHFAMSLIVDDCFSTVEQFWQASNVDPTGQKVSEPNTEPPAPSHVPVVLKRAVERPAAVSANLAGSYDGSIYDLAANVTTKMSPTEFQQSQGTISGYFTCFHTNGSFRGIIDDSTKGDQGQVLIQAVDMTKLNIEHPMLLAQHTQQYIHLHIIKGTCNPPFTCEVLIVLGGNIVKSGDWYITTSNENGTKKSFGAQGRINAALLAIGVLETCLHLEELLPFSSGKGFMQPTGRSNIFLVIQWSADFFLRLGMRCT